MGLIRSTCADGSYNAFVRRASVCLGAASRQEQRKAGQPEGGGGKAYPHSGRTHSRRGQVCGKYSKHTSAEDASAGLGDQATSGQVAFIV